MSETPPEVEEPGELDDPLHESLLKFTEAIGLALDDVCSYGLTIGETYVPFDPDPEEDCEADDDGFICSQAWVRVASITPGAGNESNFGGDECAIVLEATLEVGVLRCIEIPEGGEAPTASDVMMAALQSMDDMKAIHCAAMKEEVWDSITTGMWNPIGPLGGQYGGSWSFTVEL